MPVSDAGRDAASQSLVDRVGALTPSLLTIYRKGTCKGVLRTPVDKLSIVTSQKGGSPNSRVYVQSECASRGTNHVSSERGRVLGGSQRGRAVKDTRERAL